MQITGTQIIASPMLSVWNALNDPEVLRNCLPGCETVTQETPEIFKIVMTAAVGPLKVRLHGQLRVTEAQPPSRCVMVFEGQGGAMGFGKGSSTVELREVEGGTQLDYAASAQVGGKMAQVGSRLIDSVARKMSDDFFRLLRQTLTPEPSALDAPATAMSAPAQSTGSAAAIPARDAVEGSPGRPEIPAHPLPVAPQVATTRASATSRGLDDRREPAVVPSWWLFPAIGFGATLALVVLRFGA